MTTKVMVFDPGESTGWLCAEVNEQYEIEHLDGGTLPQDHDSFRNLPSIYDPDTVVYETFQLYPGMAKAMSWNTFYPCEVIGVIKFAFFESEIVGLAPSVKKFAGGFDDTWEDFQMGRSGLKEGNVHAVTEHTRDAYLLLKYYLRTQKEKARKAK